MTNRVITLFEQQAVPYHALGLSSSDPLLEVLERINQDQGKEIIRLERKALRTFQYVGVIQTERCTIQILPKIDYDPRIGTASSSVLLSEKSAEITAARNLIYMLIHTRNLKLHHLTLASLGTVQAGWFEMLTRLFADELLIQLKQGYHLDYVVQEDLLPYLRGRWNVTRQFVRYPDLSGGLDVAYDEYLPDTPLNRIFRLAVRQMQLITRDSENRRRLAELDDLLQPVQIPTSASAYLDKIHFTRLSERFKGAFDLARLFLLGQSVHLLAGAQQAWAFVLDMNQLFEAFVTSLLQSNRIRIIPPQWKETVIETQGGRVPKYLARPNYSNAKPFSQIKPDILIKRGSTPFLIIDAKNKVLSHQPVYASIAEDDLYQMVAYATRLRCPNVLLLYPRAKNTNVIPFFLDVELSPIRIYVATLNLHQPLDKLDGIIGEFRDILGYVHRHMNMTEETLWRAD